MSLRCAAASLLALTLGLGGDPAPATAQSTPVPAPTVVPTLPPTDPATQAILRAAAGVLNDIITRNRIDAANSAHGTVTYFRRYDMQVRIGANIYRNVRLHQGTVINPRGATPGAGVMVDISGQGAPDGTLAADTITVVR
jgi:hypothetical protein